MIYQFVVVTPVPAPGDRTDSAPTWQPCGAHRHSGQVSQIKNDNNRPGSGKRAAPTNPVRGSGRSGAQAPPCFLTGTPGQAPGSGRARGPCLGGDTARPRTQVTTPRVRKSSSAERARKGSCLRVPPRPRAPGPARVQAARGSGGARTPPPAPRHLGALRRPLGTAPPVAPAATHPRCPEPGPPTPPRPPPRPEEAAERLAGRPGRSPCPGRAGPKPRDARTQPGHRRRWHQTPPPAPSASGDWLRLSEAPP